MRYTTRAEHEASAAPKWQVIASQVSQIGNPHSDIDQGEYGWRVGVHFMRNHRSFVLPIRFGLRGDCQRAVEWLNEQCPPGKTVQDTVKLVEARFLGVRGLKAEVIPIACRF